MVDKEGTDGEAEAMKAYRAAREETEDSAEVEVGDKVSSALVDRVWTSTTPHPQTPSSFPCAPTKVKKKRKE